MIKKLNEAFNNLYSRDYKSNKSILEALNEVNEIELNEANSTVEEVKNFLKPLIINDRIRALKDDEELPKGVYFKSSTGDNGTIHFKGKDYVFAIVKGELRVMTEDEAGWNWSETILKEDFSPSLPDWLKKDKLILRKLLNTGIALDKAQFIETELPETSRQLTTMANAGKLPVLYVRGDVYIPGVNDEDRASFGKRRSFARTAIKDILDNTSNFGYIDLGNKENLMKALRDERKEQKAGMETRGEGQHKYYKTKYTPGYYDENGNWVLGKSIRTGEYTWKTDPWQDKSGYIPDPDKYKKILDNVGLEDYSKRLDSYYNKLVKAKGKVIEIINNYGIAQDKRDSLNYNIDDLSRELLGASQAYRNLLKEVNRVVNSPKHSDKEKDEEIRFIFTSKWSNYVVDLRERIEELEEVIASF